MVGPGPHSGGTILGFGKIAVGAVVTWEVWHVPQEADEMPGVL